MALVGYVSSDFEGEFNYLDNHLGGFLIPFPDADYVSDLIVTCKSCHAPTHFFLQIYSPLEHSKYHRCFYFFVCLKSFCQSHGRNWQVFRSQYLELSPINVESGNHWNICEDDESTEDNSWGLMDFEPPQVRIWMDLNLSRNA